MEDTAAPGAAAPQAGVPEVLGSPADIVERWWVDHFPGSPVARIAQAWNHAFAAKEELKRHLENLFGRA